MSKQTEDIVNEAHENVRKDRRRLEEFADSISKIGEIAGDPLAKAGLADAISRLADGLTRSNAQLVELAKLLVKKELVTTPSDSLNSKEVDGLFDEIGDGFAGKEEEEEGDN